MEELKKDIPQEERKYGRLINQDIKIYRDYFIEMTELIGIYAKYANPVPESKRYTVEGELRSDYEEFKQVGCIFDEHPNQKTLKKLGWFSEDIKEPIIIYLPFDLAGLQRGTLIELPSAIEGAEDRLFRVEELNTIMIYPASIACKVVPTYKSKIDKREVHDFSAGDFTMLKPTDNWGKSKSWEIEDLGGEKFD